MKLQLIIEQANIAKRLFRTRPDFLAGVLHGLECALVFEHFSTETAVAMVANSEFC